MFETQGKERSFEVVRASRSVKIVDLLNWIGPIPSRVIGLRSGPYTPVLRLRHSLHPSTSSGSIPQSQTERGVTYTGNVPRNGTG
jgi:hypothetical protein